jgi:dGTPase
VNAVSFADYDSNDIERLVAEAPESVDDHRGPFERDRSRIIHSAAFRRLQGKTQVYGLGASDYYRTRLTHSLEVAQIGKALALNLGADAALVEAICLAHDIGHPPFGHAGETALHEATLDADGFNANAQNIRILTNIERKSAAYDGLNLTKATLDGLIKYPWKIDPALEIRKGYYEGDSRLVELFHEFNAPSPKTFECQVMDWADDVAYSSHDLEDALAIGTIRSEDLRNPSKVAQILALATKAYSDNFPGYERKRGLNATDVESAVDDIIRECIDKPGDRIKNIKVFVGQHINDCVTTAVAEDVGHVFRRYRYRLIPDSAMVRRVEIYKAVNYACVIMTNSVLSLQQAGRKVVTDLYSVYSDAENAELRYLYPDDWSERVDSALREQKTETDPLAVKNLARDYVATMTDRFAEEQWRMLNLPGEGRLFTART